ncbi:hypothetical protein AKJ16_DCAP13980 [Drosera capensis]
MLVVDALFTGTLTVDDRPPSARSISADDRTVHFTGGVVILSCSDHRLPRPPAASGNIMVSWTTLGCHICGYQTMVGPGGILLLLATKASTHVMTALLPPIPLNYVCEHRRAQPTRVEATEKDECFGVPYPTAQNQPIVCLEAPRLCMSSHPFTICVETYYMRTVDLCILALLLKTLLESLPSAPGDSNAELVIWVEFQSGVNFHGRVKITKDQCIFIRYARNIS